MEERLCDEDSREREGEVLREKNASNHKLKYFEIQLAVIALYTATINFS